MTAEKILIIKPGAVGDLLQLTPSIRALKQLYPDARITILVGSRATASMFSHNPHVHEVLVFDRKGEHQSLTAKFKLWQRLRAGRFDLVVNYQRSNIRVWLLASAAFPSRLLVYHKSRGRIVHAVVDHLETLAPLGITATDTDLEFSPGPEAEGYAADLFRNEGLADRVVIALNPGASHPVNRWSTNHFARLADLIQDRLGAATVLIGGEADRCLAEEIATRATRVKPLVLTGKTDLQQLGAVLKKCSALVSGDTGPMHMATAVGTGVVALFGAADPARTGPVGRGHRVVRAGQVHCVPCRSRSCNNARYLECMEMITPEQVVAEIAAMLGTKGGRA